jgi:hypothetical protein
VTLLLGPSLMPAARSADSSALAEVARSVGRSVTFQWSISHPSIA